MGIVFYPRGGSAQVVRYLSRALTERGHDVTVASGSLRGAEAGADARDFYSGLPPLEVDYTEAVKSWRSLCIPAMRTSPGCRTAPFTRWARSNSEL